MLVPPQHTVLHAEILDPDYQEREALLHADQHQADVHPPVGGVGGQVRLGRSHDASQLQALLARPLEPEQPSGGQGLLLRDSWFSLPGIRQRAYLGLPHPAEASEAAAKGGTEHQEHQSDDAEDASEARLRIW